MQTLNGFQDAFVTRLDPSQSGSAQLVWSTFLGGSGGEFAKGVSVAADGSVAVAGQTDSSNFPVSTNAWQATRQGVIDAFVARLNSSGANLLYGSYYSHTASPDNSFTWANAVEIDGTPHITIAGFTDSGSLAIVNGYDGGYDGNGDAFVARFDPNAASSAASLVYSTYLGGPMGQSAYDEAFALDLDSGLIYVGGQTVSSGFGASPPPTRLPYDPSFNGGIVGDGFLIAIDPSKPPAQQVFYVTFIGGADDEAVLGVDALNGVIYACGKTQSHNFPVSVGPSSGGLDEADAYQPSLNHPPGTPAEDGFVLKLVTGLTPLRQLRYSTYFGSAAIGGLNPADWAIAIERVTSSSVVFVGWTNGNLLPVGSVIGGVFDPIETFDPTYNGGRDAFLTRLHWPNDRPRNLQLSYSTHVGGAGDDEALALVLDSLDSYFAGITRSLDYPVAGNPFQPTNNGPTGNPADGFASRLFLPPLSQ
jgi:hypothetical protein